MPAANSYEVEVTVRMPVTAENPAEAAEKAHRFIRQGLTNQQINNFQVTDVRASRQ